LSNPRLGVKRWAALIIAGTAGFMVVLDLSIVNVALPAIRSDLHMSTGALAWVVNAYTITFAGFLLVGGRAGDLFGRRETFFVGLSLFLLGSLGGAIAATGGQLIAARAIQGLGAGVLSPTTLGIVTTTYRSSQDRAKALGIFSALGASGGAVGAIAGGVITDLLNWRWVLAVNLPVGAALWLWARRALHPPIPEGGRQHWRELDVPGAVLVTVGLSLLAYAIIGTDAHGWTSGHTLIALGLTVLLFLLFILVERRSARPIVPLAVLLRQNVSAPVTVAFLFGAASYSLYFFLSLYLQRVNGDSALRAGLGFLPLTLTTVLGSVSAARLATRISMAWLLPCGCLTSAAGYLWLSAVPVRSDFLGSVFGPTAAIGLGIGLTMVSLSALALFGVAHSEAGLISGLLNTGRQCGGAIGIAALTAVSSSQIARQLHKGDAALAATRDGYALAFTCAGSAMVVALVVSLVAARRVVPTAPTPIASAQSHPSVD
jgi:EmrB/QacA subfamily drug resistance transporter